MIPYLPSVDWYVAYVAAGCRVPSTAARRYSRQLDINRCQILMPSGPQTLTIPLVADSTHGQLDEILISEHGRWRSHHWNALQTAYGKSPFFEYYADDFRPFYTDRWECLADYNAALHTTICRLMDVEQISGDASMNIGQRTGIQEVRPYYQVFAQRLGFQPHLSIVDLLFNMGPESVLWLTGRA